MIIFRGDSGSQTDGWMVFPWVAGLHLKYQCLPFGSGFSGNYFISSKKDYTYSGIVTAKGLIAISEFWPVLLRVARL